MSDDKNPIEAAVDQALDAFVYAPIGLVFDGPALFPKLVEKGRNQVKVARMMGKMAVQMGQNEAEKRIGATDGPLRDVFVVMGVVPPDEDSAPARAPRSTATAAPTAERPTESSAKRAARPAKKTAKKAKTAQKPAEAAPASSLGIADYDSLSASQVVKRLRGMDAADLDAVQTYEAATRARKTILNRIAQLQKG